MKIKSILILALIAAATATGLSAQNTSSPYSKFGYGLLRDNATSAQRQMGGVGYAMRSGSQVNVMNPAAYAATDSLTFLFDMGTDLSMFWRQDGSAKSHDWGGGLDYLTIQFPVSKIIGVSAGLVPYSSVGYSFGSEISNGVTTHQGTGGLNQLYIGAGIMPLRNLSVGFNVSYLFGNVYNDVYSSQSGTATQSLFEQVMEVKDYHLQFGLQYTLPISRKNSVTFGLTYTPSKSLLGKTYVLKYYDTSAAPDTIAPGMVNLRGNYSLPDTWGAGISYDWNGRLQAEVDVTYQNWSKAKFRQVDDFSDTKFDNRWRIGAGLSYTPDHRAGYLKRIAYRLGGFYNRDYMMVQGNHVRDYGISCGVGLPAYQKTLINLGFEYSQRQATPDPLLKEKYFHITLGINFNQVWFYHNKLR
ncbi:MAG: hypothetical protein HDR96_06370 [Bacteroides sp.]|nr:hypothetical protein [Bacteroides sp.]MBD5335009.1 hypothetical protein [Bacteroides sp.]